MANDSEQRRDDSDGHLDRPDLTKATKAKLIEYAHALEDAGEEIGKQAEAYRQEALAAHAARRPREKLVQQEDGTVRRYLDHAPKTVALCGMGPSVADLFNKVLTQEASPDFADEIWAINMAANLIWHDVVFWMDDLHDQETFKPGLFTLLRRRGKPVITSKAYPDVIPLSYDYPIDEVSKISQPVLGKPYLNNGVAQAIAYAMHIGVKKLKLFGCDFTYPNREYAESGRACTEAWVTMASLSGMEVELSHGTSLVDSIKDGGVYGYKEQPVVKLQDGDTFQYVTPEEAEKFKKEGPSTPPGFPMPPINTDSYNPEDSSGQGQANGKLHGQFPGVGSTRPDTTGANADSGHASNVATPPPAR